MLKQPGWPGGEAAVTSLASLKGWTWLHILVGIHAVMYPQNPG